MVLSTIVPGKAYYDIRFRDIPDEWILGSYCLACAHSAPVERSLIEERYGVEEHLSNVDKHLKCRKCRVAGQNRFMIYGKKVGRG